MYLIMYSEMFEGNVNASWRDYNAQLQLRVEARATSIAILFSAPFEKRYLGMYI